jgi:phytanoyl-CoA hydroxylase
MFPAKPGDLLTHHALTIHRADGNRSASRTRRSLGFIYYAASAQEDLATIQEYQQRLKNEWAAAGKI